MKIEKQAAHEFWNAASCGGNQYLQGDEGAAFAAQARSFPAKACWLWQTAAADSVS